MKYLLILPVIAGLLWLHGITAKQVNQTALADKMVNTCTQSYKVINGDLEKQCGQYIDELQAQGFEVLSSNGKFWVEYPQN